ncbi:MAG: hypothetical protein ACKOPG_03965 [Novosphingobium sp.]
MGEPGPREFVWLGVVLALLSALPVLVATYPQLVDYPAHMARFHIMLARDSSPWLQQYYTFDWRWMGNLGADMLIRPLAAIMPLETAGRVIAGIIPPLTAASLLTAEWAVRRRIGMASLLAFAFVWSPGALLGFLNFGLAQAAALFAFALWVKLDGKPWRAPLFVPIGVFVWLCHVSGWGILGIMVFGYEWHKDKSWRAFVAPWPLFFPFVSLLLNASPGQPPSYGPAPQFYKWSSWKQAMRGTFQWVDYGMAIGVCLLLAVSLFFKKWDGKLGWAAAIMLLSSLALPRHIFGGDLVDARMISAGLMVGVLCLSWRAPRWIVLLVPAVFLFRLAYTTIDWSRDSRETASALEALDGLPKGARIASYVVTERSEWGYNGKEHICGYAVMRLDALSNCNFALPGIHMITIREGGPFFRDPFHRLNHHAGRKIDISDYNPAFKAEWLWYVGQEMPYKLPPGYEVVKRGHTWFLAHRPLPRTPET